MKTLLARILILNFIIVSVNSAVAQCNVTINASTLTVPCGGGNVNLTAVGSGYNTTPINNSFDLGNAGPNWSISPAGQFNNPCGPSVDGGTYMWMGSSTAAPRTLQTAPLDLTCGGNVCFYLKFAQQGNSSPCEGPDLTTEGVYFQYSINGGTTWTTINYFQPNAGGTSGPYLNWAQYCFPIPAVAQTTSTILRWYQGGSSGFGYDHWGIDNVVVTATNCGSVWYDWANIPGTTGPNGDPASQNVFVQSDSTFTVCYTDGGVFNCCQNITISVLGMNAPNAAVTNESCPGNNDGSVILSAAGGVGPYEYLILSGPSINVPLSSTGSLPSPSFSNLEPGNYTYEINDLGSNCSVSGTFVISSPPQFVIDQLVIDDENCVSACDGSVDIIAPGGVAFALDNGVTSNVSLIGQLCPGTYNVIVTNALGCIADTSFSILPAQPINLTVSLDTLICQNGTATLIAEVTGGSGNYTYNWDNGLTNDTILVSPTVPSQYAIIASDDNGCSTPAQDIFVDILAPLSLTLTQNYIVCEGETIELSNQVTGGNGVYSYNWVDNNTGVLFSSDASPDFAVNATMNLTLTVEDACETNPVTGVVTVDMFAVPDIFITASPTPGCTPLQVYFNTSTDLSNVNNFSWNLGIGTSTDTTPVFTYMNEGCYDITFSLETNDGCLNSYTANDFVCTYLSPIADFQFINEEFSGLAPSFGVVNTSSFEDFNSWQVTAENFSYATNDYDFQIDLPTELAGDYEVCLNVSTNFGCVDSICQLFTVQDVVTVYVPNTFTPDGNEYNNDFLPIVRGIDNYNYLLEIYNRWGEKIFESRNPDFGWDGTYNGKIAPQGTYTWVITTKVLAAGEPPIIKTGYVNLIR
jgi:gliding motility-associated-like protein